MPLTTADLALMCTGTFRERFFACLRWLGINQVALKGSVGIDPNFFPARTARLPLAPFIHVREWHQPFIRDILCSPPLTSGSRFFDPQDLRDALTDPASHPAVRQACGAKAVFDVIWSGAHQPFVSVRGRSFDVTPVTGFQSGGTPFTIDIPDTAAAVTGGGFDFEFGYRLAKHHLQQQLPSACHQMAVMESFVHADDPYIKAYCAEFP